LLFCQETVCLFEKLSYVSPFLVNSLGSLSLLFRFHKICGLPRVDAAVRKGLFFLFLQGDGSRGDGNHHCRADAHIEEIQERTRKMIPAFI